MSGSTILLLILWVACEGARAIAYAIRAVIAYARRQARARADANAYDDACITAIRARVAQRRPPHDDAPVSGAAARSGRVR